MTEPYRVIIVEDDLDVAAYTKTVLEKKLGAVVQTYPDATRVPQAVAEFKPDVVITDIEMPGISGLELIELVRKDNPGLPVLVITAHASVDYAVTALRNKGSARTRELLHDACALARIGNAFKGSADFLPVALVASIDPDVGVVDPRQKALFCKPLEPAQHRL